MSKPSPTLLRIILTVFLPFASGYYMSYFFRSVNAVIEHDLKTDMSLSASGLGLITAGYFMAFAAFQIPLGILLDRFGPVRVQAALLATAAVGAFVFSLAESSTVLFIGRALIGIGVSGGLMASFKAIVLWFPKDRLPLVNGLFMSFGGLGALSATAPVEFALHITDWRGVYAVIGAATAVVAATILVLSPDKPGQRSSDSLSDQIKGLLAVYRDSLFWRLAPLTFTAAASGMAIQGLWIGPWLSDIAGLDRPAIGYQLATVTLAMTLGMAAMGIISDIAFKRWGVRPQTVMVVANMLFLLPQIGVVMEFITVGAYLWMLFGFLSNFSSITFAVLSQHFPTERSAVSNTGVNVFVFSMAFAVQYLIGVIIDQYPQTASGGYAPEGYQTAFGLVIAIQVIAIIWYFLSPIVLRKKA